MNFTTEIDPLDLLNGAEAETLSGDIRDALLTHVRSIKIPWAMLAEDEQQTAIDAIQRTAEHCVRQACAIMMRGGAPSVPVRINQWRVKAGDLKVELSVTSLVDNLIALAEHGSRTAVLVLVDHAEFIGERAPAKADKDQPDMLGDQAA